MKNVASPEKEGGSCGGQDHLCKNDGRSFLSRFTAQSHADASTRWFPRSRGIRSVAAFVFGAKFLPRAIARSNESNGERQREIRAIKKALLNADHVDANATENEMQIGSARREMHSSEIHLFVVNYAGGHGSFIRCVTINTGKRIAYILFVALHVAFSSLDSMPS